MRDSINRAAERLACLQASLAVRAQSWEGINDERATLCLLTSQTYGHALDILREETGLHPPATVPYYEPDDRGFDYNDREREEH